jgi:hypothetical protein
MGAKVQNIADVGVGADPCVRPLRGTHGYASYKKDRVCGFIRPRWTLAGKDVPKRELGNEGNII